MMGQLNHDQGEFFYSFRLDEAIPDDHPARATCVGETASRATREYLATLDNAAFGAARGGRHCTEPPPPCKTRRSTAASSCAVPCVIGVGRQLLLIKSRHPSMDG